jgi:hypothetical protein
VPLEHQLADRAIVEMHPILKGDGGEAAVVGPTQQGADFLDIDEDRHVAMARNAWAEVLDELSRHASIGSRLPHCALNIFSPAAGSPESAKPRDAAS